jgi:molecular chaperone DnaK
MFKYQTKQTLEDSRIVRMKLRDAAERAKIALSEAQEVEVKVPSLYRSADGKEFEFKARVNRNQYAQWVMPLVQRTLEVCDEALKNAGMTARTVDHVLMVGGMTRYPLIREAVGAHFGKAPNVSVNPDEVVAIGAAIQAMNLTRVDDAPSSVLLDVTPQSLSVRTVGGYCEVLIPRNTAIPTESSKVFSTAHDNQTEVRVAIFQGESRMAVDNELLGEFIIDSLPPLPRGQIRIRITFEIDADGIVHVRAIDDKRGQERSIRIEAKSGLSEEEIQSASRFDDLDF